MELLIHELRPEDLAAACAVWNEVVAAGEAFPQLEILTEKTGAEFFAEQTFTGVAEDAASGEIVGVYILHPHNVGRCGQICNASYAVKAGMRGCGIGEALVRHCIETGKACGFRVLQFNAVVASNTAAMRLYEKLGFVRLGTIPGGFLYKDGTYVDIVPHYYVL